MQKSEFKAGEHWAHRSSQWLGAPAARVELVAMPDRKGHAKVKVSHVVGELAGLEEFVHATHLRCRWKDWKKVERVEAKELAFLDRMESEPQIDRVVCQAAAAVLYSMGRISGLTSTVAIRVSTAAMLVAWRAWPSAPAWASSRGVAVPVSRIETVTSTCRTAYCWTSLCGSLRRSLRR